MHLLAVAALAMALSTPAPALAASPTLLPGAGASVPTMSSGTAVATVPSYRLVKLGVLPGDEFAIPRAINASGQVVGRSGGYSEAPRPFRWSVATGMKPLRLPAGALSGMASDVNSQGHVTGHVELADHRDVAARWTPTGRLVRLGAFGPEANSYGLGINDSGTVAGWSGTDPYEFQGQEAFIKRPGSPMVSITPGARPGFGYDINATDQISGSVNYNAIRWTNGQIRDVSGTLEGNTEGTALNSSGQVAIKRTLPDKNCAFRWTDGVGVESLGLGNTNEPTTANGINSAGNVVGRGEVPGSPAMGGYLYSDSTGLHYLPDLLRPRFSDWYISEAWDINDSGQIVAEALNLQTGATHGVLLDPV